MCEDWTKCEQCKFFDPDKCYCNRMLRTVTIGCPYGEDKVKMVGAESGAGRKEWEQRRRNKYD